MSWFPFWPCKEMHLEAWLMNFPVCLRLPYPPGFPCLLEGLSVPLVCMFCFPGSFTCVFCLYVLFSYSFLILSTTGTKTKTAGDLPILCFWVRRQDTAFLGTLSAMIPLVAHTSLLPPREPGETVGNAFLLRVDTADTGSINCCCTFSSSEVLKALCFLLSCLLAFGTLRFEWQNPVAFLPRDGTSWV